MFCDYNEDIVSKYMQGEYMQGEHMHNGNTTILSFLSSFFIIGCSIISGLSIGTFIVAQFMYPSWQKINSAYEINCDDDEDEEEEEEDYELEDEEDYTQKYMEEFKALPSRSLSLDEIKNLKTKTVEEFVKIEGITNDADGIAGANNAEGADEEEEEDGEDEELDLDFKKIIMTYNNETESFWYYTDYSTKILYPVLDMVARKFVITYDCKDLYVSLAPTDILTSALVADVKSAAPADSPAAVAPSSAADAPAVKEEVPVVKSIFAKFKMYNSEPVAPHTTTTKNNTAPTPTPTPHIIKKTNQFKYKGKLKDFSPIIKTTADLVDTETKIDYASFKKQYNLNKI